MDIAARIEQLNSRLLTFIQLLRGEVVGLDPEKRTCTFRFNVPLDYCHSGNVVQGGFVTAMLDATMSHAVFGLERGVSGLSSLEISTRYEDATLGEQELTVVGRIRKSTYRTAFLDGELFNKNGDICATAHTVAKLSRKKTDA